MYPASASRSGVTRLSEIHGRASPLRRPAFRGGDTAVEFGNQHPFRRLVERSLPLGIGAGMADDLVAPRTESADKGRCVIVASPN